MKKFLKVALCLCFMIVSIFALVGCDEQGTAEAGYTVTYDYGASADFFNGVVATQKVKATEWIASMPTIKNEYEEPFLGWFIKGSNIKIECSDSIGGNVTLVPKFDITKNAPAGVYIGNVLQHSWSELVNNSRITMQSNSIKSVDSSICGDIILSDSVTNIGDRAFNNCKGLTSITIPELVARIEIGAFYNCTGLTSITIPKGVDTIMFNAFSGCSGLTSIVVESGNTEYDSRNNCNAIIETATNTLIAGCKNTTIPNNVTSIGYDAFNGCTKLTRIEIPNNVTSIGYDAFDGCTGLTSIRIPENVTSISSTAFSYCSGLTSIVVESGNTEYDSRNNCNAIIETATNTLIAGCKNTTIPNNVTSIGSAAFNGCTKLTIIDIPNNVTSISGDAFRGCTSLTSIRIPNNVTSIEARAFGGCTGLTSIIVGSGNIKYDSRDNCNAIIETATNTLIAGCKNTTIPNSVTSIGYNAFYECTSLTGITIPNSVESIGDTAFYGCTGLTSITIPNSVESIGASFYNCSSLTSIIIPTSVDSIDNAAFGGECTGLTNIYCLGSKSDKEGYSFSLERTHPLANWFYYSETRPFRNLSEYWHYDVDGVTPIIWA